MSEKARFNTNFSVQNVNLKTAATVPTYIDTFLVSEGVASGTRDADFVEFKTGVSYSFDTLNKAFLPTDGSRHRVSFDISVPGSDLEYYTAAYQGEVYVQCYAELGDRQRGF